MASKLTELCEEMIDAAGITGKIEVFPHVQGAAQITTDDTSLGREQLAALLRFRQFRSVFTVAEPTSGAKRLAISVAD